MLKQISPNKFKKFRTSPDSYFIDGFIDTMRHVLGLLEDNVGIINHICTCKNVTFAFSFSFSFAFFTTRPSRGGR